MDERLAPFFAIDARAYLSGSAATADFSNSLLHGCNDGFGFFGRTHNGTNEPDIGIDILYTMRSERQDREAGFEDGCQRFLSIWHGCDDNVGLDRSQFVGSCGPGIVDEGKIPAAKCREDIEAVARTGYEIIQTAKAVEDDGDAGLQGNDAHAGC